MPRIFGRPLWSFLPYGSLIYLVHCGQPSSNLFFDISRVLFHVVYIPVALITFGNYISNINSTNSFNPLEQHKINQQKIERYQELNKQIFGPGGYADTNFNKELDIHEMAEAYSKLGLKQFPKQDLTLGQLEELVKKYQE